MGLHGLAQLWKTVELVKKRLNPELNVTGILACRVDRRTKHGKEVVEKVRSKFPELAFQTEIRENVRLAECPSQGGPITAYDAEAATGPRTTASSPKKSSPRKRGRASPMAKSQTARSTIKNDPFETLIPDRRPRASERGEPRRRRRDAASPRAAEARSEAGREPQEGEAHRSSHPRPHRAQ